MKEKLIFPDERSIIWQQNYLAKHTIEFFDHAILDTSAMNSIRLEQIFENFQVEET